MPGKFKKIGQSSSFTQSEFWTREKIAIYIFFVLVLVSLGLVIWSLIHTYEQRTNFKLTSDVFSNEKPQFSSYYNIPCTNETYGNETKTFSENTHLVTTCPQNANLCSEFFCGTNGICAEKVIDGGECYSSTQCNSGFSCNSTCMCTQIISVENYTPQFTPGFQVAWDITNPSFLYAAYEDLGDWVEVHIKVFASQSAITINSNNIVFEFDLPILGDTSNFGTGSIIASCSSLTAAPTQCVTCIGYVFISSASTGEIICSNQNPEYTGPSLSTHVGIIIIDFLYKKA